MDEDFNINSYTFLFYDKFINGFHNYDNPLTINIVKIDELFTGDNIQLQGDSAIEEFNKFGSPYTLSKLDEDMYKVYMFMIKKKEMNEEKNEKKREMNIFSNDVNDNIIKCTIIRVNNEQLKKYILEKKPIPNLNTLIELCKYHNNYMKAYKYGKFINQTNDYNKMTQQMIDNILSKTGDVLDPMIENPPFLKYELFPYQKKTVNWMVQKEREENTLMYNINDEIVLGDIIFDALLHNLSYGENRKKLKFSGGALIDEVGLGKTIQTLSMSMTNQATELSYIRENKNKYYSRATLIMCPNHLCCQWSREIEKMMKVDEYDIKVIPMLTKVHHDKYTYKDLLDADFVILSYSFLGGESYVNGWMKKITQSKSYHKSKDFDLFNVKKTFDDIGKENVNKPMNLFLKNAVINTIYWHRIVVDEFHEIYTVKDKYQHVMNLLPTFESKYKWCLTGTPFNKTNDCLMQMINFVTNYENEYGNKIYNAEIITNYIENNFFRRNTTESIKKEHKLLPLKETVVWLKFTQTERMMYNAYLANPTNDKYSKYLRQLCCHPKLAEETKELLSNCKTLQDIEKMMVSHYKKDMNDAEMVLNYLKNRIKISEKRIKKIERKRQRKFLRRKGFTVEIEKEEEILEMVLNEGELQNYDVNNVNINMDEEEEDDDNDIPQPGKPHIIISDNNQDEILNLVGGELKTNPSMAIKNIEDYIKEINMKIVDAQKKYDGKKTTYEFYQNVIEKIKKTSENNKNESEGLDKVDEDEEICGICLNEIPENDIGVTKCGHMFCYQCIKTIIPQKHECPFCRKALKDNEIFMISYEKKKSVETKEIKDKMALVNEIGTKLTNLIYYIKGSKDHMIIFSQWDDLLRKIGVVLDNYGIKNVFCRGNVWQRDKAIRTFSTDPNMRVIMLSSESAASGTNLTKASKVLIVDPVHGSYEFRKNTENQAIGRAQRMGQTKQVEVIRFIIRDTVEEEIYQANINEDKKHIRDEDMKIFEFTDDSITLTKDQINELAETQKNVKNANDKKTETKKKVYAIKKKTEKNNDPEKKNENAPNNQN